MHWLTSKCSRKLPVAAGVVAAVGSVWLTCKDKIHCRSNHSNSYSGFFWDYFVPSYFKTDKLPERRSGRPKLSQTIPHAEIRRNQKLVLVNFGLVSHFESNNLAANDPIEDRNSEYRLSEGLLFSVYDGHSGWHCAEEVMKRLPYYIAVSLQSHDIDQNIPHSKTFDKIFSTTISLDETCVSNDLKNILGANGHDLLNNDNTVAIKDKLANAYRLLDDDIVYESLPKVNGNDHEKTMTGLAGACAITAYINGCDLYVANSGDCRAVLGSRSSDGKWIATPLSTDQNAFNLDENDRVKQEHPGEDYIIRNGRLLGYLQPFRAFGDVMFKWNSQLHKDYLNDIYGRVVMPPQIYLTPPYLTAVPVVTHHTLNTEDKFLVIASDGLWDMMSNDAAVQYVGDLLDHGSTFGNDEHGNVVKRNAASQLIHEALGGDDRDKMEMLLHAPRRVRRNVRDDMTITVVYFVEN